MAGNNAMRTETLVAFFKATTKEIKSIKFFYKKL